MEIKVAKTAGFCFGVKRAVEETYALSSRKDKRIFTYGPVIHNQQVVSDLEKNGVFVIEDLEKLDKDSLVIIRAHGVGKKVYDYFEEKEIEYVDLTCPFVKKIHNIVKNSYDAGKNIVLIGKKNHPEVIGINGWCGDSAVILYDEDQAGNVMFYDRATALRFSVEHGSESIKLKHWFKNWGNAVLPCLTKIDTEE